MPRRLKQLISKANSATDQSRRLMTKTDILVDVLLNMAERIDEDGIDVQLEVAGITIPAKIKIDLGQEE